MARRHFMPGPTKFQSFVWKGKGVCNKPISKASRLANV